MRLERKQDLSMVYYLKGLFEPLTLAIPVVDGFPTGDLTLPSVSVEAEDVFIRPHELGNRAGRRERLWSIDVFGANKAQRDEITSVILDDVESGIPVYNYDEGFDAPSQIGLLRTFEITATPIRIFPELVEKLYWRTRIRFITEYSTL